MLAQKALVLALVLGGIAPAFPAQGVEAAAIVVAQAGQDRKAQADRLLKAGEQATQKRQFDAAEKYLQAALLLYLQLQNRSGEGNTLYSLGDVYYFQQNYRRAIEFYQQALVIRRETNDRSKEARTLNDLGLSYSNLGEKQKALDYYNQSLPITKALGNRHGEASILNNIGLLYSDLDENQKALNYYNQALLIWKAVDNRREEANTLNNIGLVYHHLSQNQQALKYYNQSLPILNAIGDRSTAAITLNNIGLVYHGLGETQKALDYYNQALLIQKAVGNHSGKAMTLNNIGGVYSDLKENERALDYYRQALPIWKAVGDPRGQAITLSNIGLTYYNLGNKQKALDHYNQALPIHKAVGNRSMEATTLNHIGSLLIAQKQPELAIVFYKQSVNVRESIRKDIHQLPKEQQATYTQSIESTYRRLADLLLQQNRIMEALQVLDLLKAQELQDYLRDNKNNPLPEQKLPFLEPETQLLQQITPAIATQTLHQQLNSPSTQTLVQQLQSTAPAQNLTLSTYKDLQTRVQKLGQNIALFYPLILDDRLELVVFLPNRPPLRRTVPVPRKQLEATIQTFAKEFVNPPYTWDVKAPAQQLYTWLIQPFAADLQQANVQTIVYAPDGQMRYVPLAALYDGQQWLAQRFQINYLTALALTPLAPRPSATPRILAGAYTQGRYTVQVAGQSYEFSGLSFARAEVQQLATQFPNTTALFDQAFDRPTILAQKERYTILHFATHAKFVPGRPEDSFIVMGDGSQINLREIADWKLPETQLVVLSACQTAIGEKLGNGLEVLGFGYQLQRSGVRASIASLWSVNDAGTQTLMNNFYAILKASNLSETAALQKAQIALMTNQTAIDLRDKRDVVHPLTLNQPTRQDLKLIGYAHPYYWAPFILIGNGL
jgi:CHAT domain-containing protein/predicted negative regulator of RcsB-dependent stress response